MMERLSLRICLACLLIPSLSTALVSAEQEAPRPKVLMVFVDDLRTPLGSCGDTLVQTPNIDRLVSSSRLFTRAYCQQSVRGPFRAAILTGRLPDYTGVWHNGQLFRTTHAQVDKLDKLFDPVLRLGLDNNTVVVLLGNHGYSFGDADRWCKDTNFELDAHVPLMIRTPALAQPSVVTDSLVENVDPDREPTTRRDVMIRVSYVDGLTWPVARCLQPGPGAYCDSAVLPGGTVLCFFESVTEQPVVQRKRDWAYANLTLARFHLAWLGDQAPFT